MDLTANELEILEKIVGFGGYVTHEMLSLYRTDISQDRCYRILKSLESKGYIKKRDYFESHRNPDVYQVTKKACRIFGREESYMRKKHKPYAIRRYLMRSHFLFALSGNGVNIINFSPENRVAFLREKGFSDYYLPKRDGKVQIDEYIIDDEHYTKGRVIWFAYIDNPDDTPRRQLMLLFNKYELMQKSKLAFLNFLIVTENSLKANIYKEVYQKFFFKKISMVDIKTRAIEKTYKPTI
jgi:hypothetical protein